MVSKNFYGVDVTISDKSIVILCGPGFGDTILSTGHVPELAKKYPHHNILACAGTPALADVYKFNPYVDTVALPFGQSNNKRIRYTVNAALYQVGKWAAINGAKIIYPVMNFHTPNKYCIDKYNIYYSHILRLDKRQYITANLYFSETERTDADSYISAHSRPYILIEGYNHSGQSNLQHSLRDVLNIILYHLPTCTIFVASPRDIPPIMVHNRVKYINNFTVRQTCLLYNKCDMFISSGSGVSHACSCTEANKNVLWLEWICHKWLSTKPYDHNNKIICDSNAKGFYLILLKTICRLV